MMGLKLDLNGMSKLNILCLGAHCDDIEIGCGGSVMKLIQDVEESNINWVIFTSNKDREQEAMKSANLFLYGASNSKITVKNFKDGHLPYNANKVKDYFEQIKQSFNPDLIFTHYRKDLHQDHRLINELTWNTFRNHLILEYEIPKYDGDMGKPNFYFPIDDLTAKRKAKFIYNNFQSQQDKHWFDKETFLSTLRLRGVESASRYSEAFYLRKAKLQNINEL